MGMDWTAVLAVVALINLVLTVGGGLIAFGALRAKLEFQAILLDRIEHTVTGTMERHERYIDDLRRGRGYINDPEARGVNREYGQRQI